MHRVAMASALVASLAAGCSLQPLELPGGPGGGGAGGSPDCAADGGCDDGNPCTRDRCDDGRCASAPLEAGVACDDGDLCNGFSRCNDLAQCIAGPPRPIDDGDPCTVDACDPATGDVTHAPDGACGPWAPLPTAGAPSPRGRHTAVWTGTRMVVWGGLASGAVTATGGAYDPAAGTWTPTSTAGAPAPRHSHAAVWTGSRMLVWGGYGASDYEATGALYDPETDTWAPIAAAGAPAGRTETAAAWTGAELIVWGGLGGGGATLSSGGRYDLALDAWTPTPAAGSPSARFGHSAVWTGGRVIVWGGNDLFNWHQDGRAFDPAAGAWGALTEIAGAPERRERHTAIWTGAQMLVWGGWNGGDYLPTGALLDPATGAEGQWAPMTTDGAPAGRGQHAAVWTGDRLVVWGGCGGDACGTLLDDGGVWTPGAAGGSWAPIPPQPPMTARRLHTAVYTGRAVLVWGGQTASGPTDTGGALIR